MIKNIIFVLLFVLLLPGNLFLIFHWYKTQKIATDKMMLDSQNTMQTFNNNFAIIGDKDNPMDDFWVIAKNGNSIYFTGKDGNIKLSGAISKNNNVTYGINKKGEIATLVIDHVIFFDFGHDNIFDMMLKDGNTYFFKDYKWQKCQKVRDGYYYAITFLGEEYIWQNNSWVKKKK